MMISYSVIKSGKRYCTFFSGALTKVGPTDNPGACTVQVLLTSLGKLSKH